jgi:SpoVK/Ycf46/Vps4 family AAA+-type ATPase
MASPDVVTGQQSLDHFGVEGPGALILEDLDLWDMPWMDMSGADFAAFLQMQLSRGAREAMQFIQSALENPEVSVFISASNLDALDALFGPMLGLYRVVEIDQPSAEERKDIWRHAQEEHPSMRGLDLGQMVPFSNGLSRFELYAIITEAVEEAYRRSIEKECFCAVRTDDVLMRLSNFFELDSEEYQGIEAVVLDHFHHSMDFIDNLLKED